MFINTAIFLLYSFVPFKRQFSKVKTQPRQVTSLLPRMLSTTTLIWTEQSIISFLPMGRVARQQP